MSSPVREAEVHEESVAGHSRIVDAIEARVTRFTNQLFPQSGHYVDCTSADGEIPYEVIALANHYIKASHFKTQVVAQCRADGASIAAVAFSVEVTVPFAGGTTVGGFNDSVGRERAGTILSR